MITSNLSSNDSYLSSTSFFYIFSSIIFYSLYLYSDLLLSFSEALSSSWTKRGDGLSSSLFPWGTLIFYFSYMAFSTGIYSFLIFVSGSAILSSALNKIGFFSSFSYPFYISSVFFFTIWETSNTSAYDWSFFT